MEWVCRSVKWDSVGCEVGKWGGQWSGLRVEWESEVHSSKGRVCGVGLQDIEFGLGYIAIRVGCSMFRKECAECGVGL